MILSFQRAELDELDALLSHRELVHPHFRLRVVDNRNVITEDAMFTRSGRTPRAQSTARPVITVLLSGQARVRAFGREEWLSPGDASIVSDLREVEMRQQGEHFRSLVLEWDSSFGFGELPSCSHDRATLDAPALEALRDNAGRLLRHELSVPEAALGVHELVRVLGAAGLPIAPTPAHALIADVSPQDTRLARAMDNALSCMKDRPMLVDLERDLNVSARHVTRLVTSFNQRYRSDTTTWLDARKRRRLAVGAFFMTRDGATSDLVAKRVGYASASTFCRALADAGLPSPARVRETVRELG